MFRVGTYSRATPPSEAGATWRVYSPGAQPAGRNVTPGEVDTLVNQPTGDRVYLSGDFVVTARGDNKAVFRPRGIGPDKPIRIVAEFPNGALLPQEGEVFSRNATRGFQITSVSRADDGTINVYAREITRSQ